MQVEPVDAGAQQLAEEGDDHQGGGRDRQGDEGGAQREAAQGVQVVGQRAHRGALGGGAGSRPGAALSRETVQKRSATPVTKTVTSSQASASPGAQSIQRGAMTSSASRSTSAPIIVHRRSSGPEGAVSVVSGPSRTAPKSRVDSIRAAKTAVTARAAPL